MKMPPTSGTRLAKRSTTSVDGVMGYPAANRAPAARAPSQQAWSPSRKCTPVRTPLGSGCMAESEDSEVRAIEPAEVATAAFIGGNDVWRVVTLGVEGGGKGEDVGGAELHAEATALTALDCDLDRTFGHREGRCTWGANLGGGGM